MSKFSHTRESQQYNRVSVPEKFSTTKTETVAKRIINMVGITVFIGFITLMVVHTFGRVMGLNAAARDAIWIASMCVFIFAHFSMVYDIASGHGGKAWFGRTALLGWIYCILYVTVVILWRMFNGTL